MVILQYLLIVHASDLNFEYSDYLSPLMVSVQKITSLAFAVHDGTQREEKDLTPNQKNKAVK